MKRVVLSELEDFQQKFDSLDFAFDVADDGRQFSLRFEPPLNDFIILELSERFADFNFLVLTRGDFLVFEFYYIDFLGS